MPKIKTASSSVVLSDHITSTSNGFTHTVSSKGVVSESGKTGKLEVTADGIKMNSGNLEVK